ncbi:MAG: hypothetical protein KIS94_13990 [Chitinophagales bacterium]|nr:hypothetical protein [Chitinophagales bacterium]
MFRNNVGINQEVFDRRHNYFTSIPAPILKQVLTASGEIQNFKAERLSVLLLDRAKQFIPLNVPGKRGKVLLHRLTDVKATDYKAVLAEAMAKLHRAM